jgi:hypothetical protein
MSERGRNLKNTIKFGRWEEDGERKRFYFFKWEREGRGE